MKPSAKKIQPMGFSGRCEAIKAPTTENDTAMMARWAIGGPPRARKILSRVRSLRRARIRLAAASATLIRHSDPANHVATRALIPPTPRSCSLAPCVTTPLYSTTVSQALRQTLRGKGLNNIDPHHQPRAHGGPGDGCGVRDTSLSPSSVSVVNTLLIPSESDEDGF